MNSKSKYVVIVAHPDDEILFASTLLKKAEKIIICFSEIPGDLQNSLGREMLIEKYFLKNCIFLRIPQARSSNLKAKWNSSAENEFGILGNRVENAYKNNFEQLIKIIPNYIKDIETVYTHNPWGEYGHVEHIQIYRIMKYLSEKYMYKLKVFGYVSMATYKFMLSKQHLLYKNPEEKILDQNFCKRVENLYKDCSCWTWQDHYIFPRKEYFYEITLKNKKNHSRKLLYLKRKQKVIDINSYGIVGFLNFVIDFIYYYLRRGFSKLKKIFLKITLHKLLF